MIYSMSKNPIETFPGDVFPPHYSAQVLELEVHWVNEVGKDTAARLTSNITLVPTDAFGSCPRHDIVHIVSNNVDYRSTAAELAFVRKRFEECIAFLTICGGVLGPIMAGLLEGKTATGPQIMIDELRKQSPTTNWVEKRWARDGKFWSSGTLLNGTHLVHGFCRAVGEELGSSSLVDYQACPTSWPVRDVDYRDEV